MAQNNNRGNQGRDASMGKATQEGLKSDNSFVRRNARNMEKWATESRKADSAMRGNGWKDPLKRSSNGRGR